MTRPDQPSARHRQASGRSARPGRARVVGLVAVGLLAALVVGGVGGAVMASEASSSSSSDAPGTSGRPSPTVATPVGAELPSSPTMLARVVSVEAGDAVTVDVAGSAIAVRVLGIDAPDPGGPGRAAECGGTEAARFATDQLVGQPVTLVPDPTVPEVDEQGRRLTYVVLRSQLSFTDAALMAGVARTDTSRPLWYADVFTEEQQRAAAAGTGIWGAPCRQVPTG